MKTEELKNQLIQQIEKLPETTLLELSQLFNDFLQKKEIEQKPKKRTFGSMKGLVKYMADDFDAPLDDFKEYM